MAQRHLWWRDKKDKLLQRNHRAELTQLTVPRATHTLSPHSLESSACRLAMCIVAGLSYIITHNIHA